MKYLSYVFPLFFGILFSLGLGVSGMMSPVKVQGFLDIVGSWDPDLMFVLGGAVLTTLICFPVVLQKAKPRYGEFFHLPTRQEIDGPLIAGAALFGAGWALGGLCPGPALANLTTANPGVWVVFLSMLLGMFIGGFIKKKLT